jgi:gamma-glutamyltranspeptidase/glutathione hydrolase
MQRIRAAASVLSATLLALVVVSPAPSAATGSGSPYSLSAQALLGGGQTDLYLRVSSDGAPPPDTLDKVELKAFSLNGKNVSTDNLFDVPAPGGVAVISRSDFVRGQLLEVKAHVKQGSQNELVAETHVALRPDLTVELHVPETVVRRQGFSVIVSLEELAGDTGASATVSVFDGLSLLATHHVEVGAGGKTEVPFAVNLPDPGSHTLLATVSESDPGESDTTNNSDHAPINVRVYDGDGAVVTEEKHATEVGAEILKAGGNAIDSAAAVEFALNVTLPHTNGIGGGSTILVHLADGENYAIDAREKAPAAAEPTMFVGKTPLNLRNQSGCTVGVPGTLAAVDLMLGRWGTMSLADTLQRPIELAEDGFPVGVALANATTEDRSGFQPETRAIFRLPDGSPLPPGYLLKQPDLAKTFRLLAAQGPSAFYEGEIAPALVAAQTRTRATGCPGRMTIADLAAYRVKISNPISTRYRDYDVVTVPPSSSGGLVLSQALEMLQRFPLGDASLGYGAGAGKTLNVMIESLRLALADRLMWMGDDDPTFGYPVPVQCLLSDGYAALRSGLISDSARIPTVTAGKPCGLGAAASDEADQSDSAHTTHFSIVDKWGNVVSFTTTLTDGFGTGITVPGYGFVLNDSLANFNLSPVKNPVTGNPGANDPGPNRRAMGNTTPVLLFKDGEPLVATGSPGSGWIPSIVLQVVSNVIDHGMPIQQAVDAPRIWLNGPAAGVGWNAGFAPESIAYLRALGQPITREPSGPPALGSAESLAVDPASYKLYAASDPRAPDGSAIVLP